MAALHPRRRRASSSPASFLLPLSTRSLRVRVLLPLLLVLLLVLLPHRPATAQSPDLVGLEHIIPSTPIALLDRTAGRSAALKIDQYTQWYGPRKERYYSVQAAGAERYRTVFGLPGGVANGNDYNLAGENVGEIVQNVHFGRNAMTLSEGRSRLAVVSLGQQVLFAGGNGGRSGLQEELASTRVDILNICENNFGCLNTFTHEELLSEGREDLVGVASNGQALFAGGLRTLNKLFLYSATVDIYDQASNKWTVDSLSQARAALAAAAVKNMSFFGGGVTGIESETYYTDTVDIYNKDADPQWTVAKLSQQRGHLAATSCNGMILFGGGFYLGRYTDADAVGFSDRVDVYDPSTKKWTATSLSEGRGKLAAAAVGTKAVFAGGISEDGPSSVIDIYDTATGLWTVAALSQRRSGLVGVSMDCPGRRLAIFVGGLATGGFSRWHLEGQR